MLQRYNFMSLALAGALCAFTAVAEENTPTADTVVATVNGTEITLGHMAIARSGLPQQYLQLPDDVLFNAILDQLVNQAVLASNFEGDEPANVKRRLENERRSLIAQVKIEQIANAGLTEEALKKAYEEKYAEADPEREYNAAHILVETEEKAAELIELLKSGDDFAELAKEHSTGPSGPNGGELGWFGAGMMVPPFEAAVVEMEEGAVSGPVETQFGWHVILLKETRLKDKPSFEDVKADLENELFNSLIEAEIDRLKKLGSVDMSADQIDPSMLKDETLIVE